MRGWADRARGGAMPGGGGQQQPCEEQQRLQHLLAACASTRGSTSGKGLKLTTLPHLCSRISCLVRHGEAKTH